MEWPAAFAVLEMFHLSDQKKATSAGYQFKYCSTANCAARACGKNTDISNAGEN
jgi:hypothetical protein